PLFRSFPDYARAMQVVISHFKGMSAATAAAYLRAFREVEGVTGNVDVAYLAALARQQALTSLYVTGPAAIKVATRGGRPVERAREMALSQTLGSVIRLVLQGGRDTITETIKRDRQALGFARVTDGDPCYFCAMLASRGA